MSEDWEHDSGDGKTNMNSDAWFQYSYDAASNETERFCSMNGVAQDYGRDELGRINDVKVYNAAAPQYGATGTAVDSLAVPSPTVPRLPVTIVSDGLPALVPGLLKGLSNLTNATGVVADVYTPPVGTLQSEEQYTYWPTGEMHTVTRSYDGSDTTNFTYDGTSQLTNATLGWNQQNMTYQLDHFGNRTSVSGGGPGTGSYTRNTAYMNEYTNAPAGMVTNDSSGEHQITGYANMSYSYYGDRRLASAVGNGHSYYMYYDALGRCVIRQMDGVTTYYTYDGEKPIYEWKADGSVAGWQLYGKGIDEILLRGDFAVQWPSDGSYGHGYFYQQDHEGSVTHLMSFQGSIIESYRYDAFARPTLRARVGTLYNNRFKFTGREWVRTPNDSFEFGLYEYRNRGYNPDLGRFMSEDPKGFDAGDYNLFRYCGNDPLDRTDPMGLYGRAANEWTDEQWQKYEQNQDKAIQIDAAAKSLIDHAITDGKDKGSKAVSKAFSDLFARTDRQTMQRASDALGKKIAALKDDGRKGYWAHPQTDRQIAENTHRDPTLTPAWTHPFDKNIYVNVGRWSDRVLTWAIDHEAGHSAMGFGDFAYMHEKRKWNYNAMSAADKLMNSDSHTALAHIIDEP